jgi:hypothetical protein
LIEDLEAVQKAWAPFMLILAMGEPPKEWTGIIRHIRVFEITPDLELDEGFLLQEGLRLQDVFARLGDRWEEGTIERAQDAILRITSK